MSDDQNTPPTIAHRPIPDRVTLAPSRRATARLRALPSFVVIGAMKSGTTSIHAHLCRHPQVLAPLRKEASFFNIHAHYRLGPLWYRALFPLGLHLGLRTLALGRRVVTGESSPGYMHHPHAPARLAQLLPDARLVAILRDPTERAWSHWQHARRTGWETRPFVRAVRYEMRHLRTDHARVREDPTLDLREHQWFSYILRGRYAEHLKRWFGRVGRQRVLVVQAEAYFREPAATFARVCEHLGLEPMDIPPPAPRNAARARRQMAPAVRDRLMRYFAPLNERLYTLIGERFDWPTP